MDAITIDKKIEYLKTAIKLIEDKGNYYDWYSYRSCNCGWVVKAIRPSAFDEECEPEKIDLKCGYGEAMQRCQISNRPIPFVIQILIDAGFTLSEITKIEDVGNVSVKNRRAILHETERYSRKDAIAAIQNVIDSLESQLEALKRATV